MDLQALKDRIEKNKKKLQETSEELSTFDLYINAYQLKEGVDKTPSYLLYYSYIEFMKQHEEDLPLSKITFCKRLKKLLKFVRWGKQRYYLIDKSSFKITEDLEFKALLWHKSQHLKKEKTS